MSYLISYYYLNFVLLANCVTGNGRFYQGSVNVTKVSVYIVYSSTKVSVHVVYVQ